MKFIAHRGNLNGPEPDKENSITQIKKCIELGFDVEIDLRVINEELWLGHDQPKVKVIVEGGSVFVFSWSPWTYNGIFRTQGLLSITDKRLITSSSCAKKK